MTGSNATPIWDAGLTAALANRPVVYFGPGIGATSGVAAAGADIRAAVEVVVTGAKASDAQYPVYTMETTSRSTSEVQVSLFPDVLEQRADDVLAFLAQHDPDEEAVVLAPLPVPSAAIGRRASWTTEATLARQLEAKRATGHALNGVLPWVPSEAVPDHVDTTWWTEIIGRLACERLVVQAVGLNAGGETTWLCSSLAEVAEAAGAAGDSRVSAYIDGLSINVMGCVGAHGAVMVLPPSRQLLDDTAGRALYVGNSFDGITEDASSRLIDDARRAGHALAARGYVGAFGLDVIVDESGQLLYHDLNARVNGSVHAFDLLFPAMAGLLAAPGWLAPEVVEPVETELRALLAERPIARWSLTEVVTQTTCVRVPRAGLYRIDRDRRRAVHLDDAHLADAVQEDTALLRPRRQPDRTAEAGDVVVVGDLWCGAQFAAALEDELGGNAMAMLLEAVRDASAG